MHSEGLDCIISYKLGSRFNKRLTSSRDSDRPVPNVRFHYHLDTTALEVDPIPGLCGDFIITFWHREDDFGGGADGHSVTFSMRLPENYFITIHDQFMELLIDPETQYVLLYKKEEKKLVYQRYKGRKWRYSLNIEIPKAKRIVFGTTGNYQLLLDLKHDDRPAVNVGSEYLGLISRPADEYKFTENYSSLLTTPTETRWSIKFGKAETYRGGHAENALIVDDTLWTHLSREGNDMCIIFTPSEGKENRWTITVKKGKQRMHRARVDGVNTLAYHEGLV